MQVSKASGGTFRMLTCALFTESFCLGMVIPSLPALLGTNAVYSNGLGFLPISSVTMGALVFAAYAAMQFASAPFLGSVSDRCGRKPLIVISLIAAAASYAVLALTSAALPILVARALAGLAGSVWLPANSAVSDVIAPAARASAFGKLASASALGYIIGPVVGGSLSMLGGTMSTLTAAALSAIVAIFCSLVFAETKGRSEQNPARYTKPSSTVSNLALRFLPELSALVLIQIVYRGQILVWPYYGKILFDWSSADVGWVMGIYALTMISTQALVTGRLVATFGPRTVCILGLIFAAASYGFMALASSALAVCLVVGMGSATALISPSFQAFATNKVVMNQHGQFQGLVTAAVSLASISGPLILAQFLPGGAAANGMQAAPFLLAALLLTCAAALIGKCSDAPQARE